MDLVTVVSHELGHVLGFDHSATGVMESSLAPGVRIGPEALPGGSRLRSTHDPQVTENQKIGRTRIARSQTRLTTQTERFFFGTAGFGRLYLTSSTNSRPRLKTLSLTN
jgi:hypothetical protein